MSCVKSQPLDILSLLCPARRGRIAMLGLYFDESESANILTLGGFIADVRRWERFHKEWKKVLAEFHIPYFHMKEFAHSRGIFEGWKDDPRRDVLMKRIVWTIKSHVSHGFAVMVDTEEYDQRFKDLIFPGKSPYFLCHYSCYGLLMKHCKKFGIKDGIAVVFDETVHSQRIALGIYGAYKRMPDWGNAYLSSLTFADDKVLSPLQAADVFAYEANKYHRGYRRKSLASLADVPHSVAKWDSQTFPRYVDQIRQFADQKLGEPNGV
jgi:hypothetical protein